MNYSNATGKMYRDLAESPKNITKFTSYDSNCFILEFHMLIVLERFRRHLVTDIFSSLYGMQQQLGDKLVTGEEFAASMNFAKQCSYKSDFSIAKMVENHHKKFIKKKINLDPKVILTSQALLEFFVEGYLLYYNSNSFFCSKYYRCAVNEKDCKDQCIIVIDCIGNIVCLKYDLSVFNKKMDDLQLKPWARDNLRFIHHISETDFSYLEKNLTFTVIPRFSFSNEAAISYVFKADNKQTLDYLRTQVEALKNSKAKVKV